MSKQITTLLVVFNLALGAYLKAQDIHHSQFYTSPLNVNPALTGIFNGDNRYAANVRGQWFVDELVKYLTFTGSFDKRFYPKKWTTRGMWNGGILFNFDRAGDSKLSLGYLGVSASYAYPITKNNKNIISLGALIGGTQRHFYQDALRWGEQFNPSKPANFDASLLTEDLSNQSNSFIDLSTGINYRWQESKRTKIDFGIGVYHLNRPEQQFFNQTSATRLPMRLNINLTPSFKLTENLDLLLHGQYQNQKPYKESVFGAYAKIYLSTKDYKKYAVQLGLASRLNDAALIPKLAIEYNQWIAGFSYDINSSPWKIATGQRGGPEFSFIYIMTKSRPLELLKACPIF